MPTYIFSFLKNGVSLKRFTIASLSLGKDLLIVNALSVLLVLAVFFFPDSSLRLILGLPFVLLFPGYLLVSVLFPGKTDLGAIERVALSVGVSLALVPLVCLGLNFTSLGIKLYPTVSSLFILSVTLSIVSFYRRSNMPIDKRVNLSIRSKLPKWSTLKKADKWFVIAFFVAVLAISSVAVYLAFSPKIGQQFTEFYILGSNNKLADYPVNITLGEKCNVSLGITNHEYEDTSYSICITTENQTIQTINDVHLSHQMNWSQNCTFELKNPGQAVKVDFDLYKEGLSEPYRSLHLWINVHAL